MHRLRFGLSLWFALAISCGGSKPAPTTPPATDEKPTPHAQSEPAKAEADVKQPERKNDAAKYLALVEEVKDDPNQRGRVAAAGLAEDQFELPALVRKTLEAISGESIDPSQSARIVVALFEEDSASQEAFRAGCGVDWAKIAPEIQKLTPPKRTDRVVELCKVEKERLGDPKTRDKLNFASVALSVVLEKLLEKRGGISDAERKLARHVAQVQRIASKP